MNSVKRSLRRFFEDEDNVGAVSIIGFFVLSVSSISVFIPCMIANKLIEPWYAIGLGLMCTIVVWIFIICPIVLFAIHNHVKKTGARQ